LQQKKHVILITHLYTDYYHFNEYLYHFNIIKIFKCNCDAEKEMINHYLLKCELYNEKKKKLKKKIKMQRMTKKILFNNYEIIRNMIKYIEKTEQFKF